MLQQSHFPNSSPNYVKSVSNKNPIYPTDSLFFPGQTGGWVGPHATKLEQAMKEAQGEQQCHWVPIRASGILNLPPAQPWQAPAFKHYSWSHPPLWRTYKWNPMDSSCTGQDLRWR